MLHLKNHFIMAPVKTGYGNKSGAITEKHLQFYKYRSQYLGAITPEPLFMDAGLKEIPTQIGIDTDDKIPGLKKLTDEIHHFNTKVIAHLNHPGRMANPKIPGNYFISATAEACEAGGAKPKAMTADDITHVIQLFVDSAVRAEKAGFDIIELQFGHGYLMAQFLSPKINNRTDAFGGSFENRIRLPLQVLEAVKNAIDLPVIVRISGDEMIPDGIKLEEMVAFSKILEEKSVDAIHVSAGTVCNTPPWYFQHMFVPKGKTWALANKIKDAVRIPIIYVGQINEFTDFDKILTTDKSNFIAIGRPLVADPDIVGKYLGEVKGNLRPCLACSEGCLGGVKSGQGLGCTVNPLVGRENQKPTMAQTSKNIAIIGGGLAGMTAAITLKQRGHQVTIYEKDTLGGQFTLASLPPHKESLHKIIHYLVKELQDHQINIIQKEAHKADLSDYDELIIATGSKPSIPPIEGLKDYYWAEVLEEHHLPENKRTLVVGGGLIGTEIASKLLSKGNQVFIVEMLGEIARGMEMIEQKLTLKALQNEKVEIFINTRVKRIIGSDIEIEKAGEIKTLKNIDIIVLATGMKAYNPFENLQTRQKVHIIGDALRVGKAKDAIENAYDTALEI